MRKTRIQVQRAVTHVIIRGRHPYEFVKELRKESGNSTYEIRRLLITETARVQTMMALVEEIQEFKGFHGFESELQCRELHQCPFYC